MAGAAALAWPFAATMGAAAQSTDPPASGTMPYSDRRLDPLPPLREWSVFFPRAAVRPLGPDRDPKFNVLYPLRRYVQCRSGDDAQIRFVIHYLRQEDLALVQRAGGVLARLFWLAVDYLGLSAAQDGQPIDVWLSRSGDAGGEEWGRNIYLFAIDTPRAPAEWLRELAHEFAHHVLPEIGPFDHPEPWASGYLGERLFLKWLLQDNRLADAWGAPVSAADYVALQVAPLRDRFLARGPLDPGGDPEPMDTLIGEVLTLEAMHGPALLRAAWTHERRQSPALLAGYLAAAVQEAAANGLRLDPSVSVPEKSRRADAAGAYRTAVYRVLLTGGNWRVEADGAIPDGMSATLDGKPLAPVAGATAWSGLIDAPTGAWHLLELHSGGQPFTLRGLRLKHSPG